MAGVTHKYIRNIYARFLSKVDTNNFEHDACWIWRGASKGNGYGHLNVDGKNITAHRLAYQLFVGVIADGMDVCHTCDNRQCVNPDHLFLGTRKENMNDAMQKGRTDGGKKKLLRECDIQEIRQRIAAGIPSQIIAKKFNITIHRLNGIKSGRTYAGVGNAK